MSKKKITKLRTKLAEGVIREQNLRRRSEQYWETLAELWKWNGDPAVRAIILDHIPGFQAGYNWHITDSSIKETYLPRLKEQLEQSAVFTGDGIRVASSRGAGTGMRRPGVDAAPDNQSPVLCEDGLRGSRK